MGGWATTETQGTVLTPRVVREALNYLPQVEHELNERLRPMGLEPVTLRQPVGSVVHLARDEVERPERIYGDIDVLLEVPGPQATYAKALGGERNVLVPTSEGPVQVDLVWALRDAADWARHRMTPEYGVKGAALGYLYTALGLELGLSFGTLGVQVKERGTTWVSFRTLRPTAIYTITTDVELFGVDVAETVVRCLRPGRTRVSFDPELTERPGLRRNDVRLADLVQVVRGIILTLDRNGALGQGHLAGVPSARALLDTVRRTYQQRVAAGLASSKYDKAVTPLALARAERDREELTRWSNVVLRELG